MGFFQGRKFILFLLALPQMRNRCCYFKVGPLFKPSAPRRRPTSLDLSLCRQRVGFNDPAAAVDLSLVTSLPSQVPFLFPPFISPSISSSRHSTSTSVRSFAKRCQRPASASLLKCQCVWCVMDKRHGDTQTGKKRGKERRCSRTFVSVQRGRWRPACKTRRQKNRG